MGIKGRYNMSLRARLKLRIATKLLISFLLLSVVSFAIVGYLALFNISEIRHCAEKSSSTLASVVANDSAMALEELGELMIQQKATDVANQVRIYLAWHPGKMAEEFEKDPDLVSIAFQPIGETGYTCLYEKETGIMRIHANSALINFDMHNWQEKLPSFWEIFQPSLDGSISKGYYDWQDTDGKVRQKFMYMVPVEGTGYMVAATTYIDEFLKPAAVTKSKITAATDSTLEHIREHMGSIRNIFIGFFVGIVLAVSGLVFFLSRMITKPIETLARGSEAIGQGNLDYKVEISTGDELEDLANSFNKMTSDLKGYTAELRRTTAEKERIESDLRIAGEIQASMLPRTFPPFPNRKEVDIFATIEPAKEVGGDFYDFFFVKENKLCFLIGDVSGKGVPAALFMAATRTLLKNEALRDISPGEILSQVNNTLCPDNDACMFATIACAILNTETGEVELSNAGHNPPLIYRGNRGFEFIDVPKGIAAGVIEDTGYDKIKLTLKPGDIIFLYTDGVTEAMNPEGELFSEERLRQCLSELKPKDAENVINLVRAEITTFVREALQADDITMLALEFKGKAI